MNRRQLFTRTASSPAFNTGRSAFDPVDSTPDMPSGRRRVQSTTGLEPYGGPWGFDQAAHLLRRTTFGLKKADLDAALKMSMSQTVDMLLAPVAMPSPVPNYNDGGTSWVDGAFNSGKDAGYQGYLISWWIGLMLNQGISITEKMTLFWHNHFACGYNSVKDARYMYKQNTLLRANALGNFKELTRQITLDPAMLRYLNGNTNTKASPNENYGRELQELFTIGKGPEIAPGDYTNYTEADVKAAAHVLTGWADDATAMAAKFNAGNHDTADKTFSAAYGNRVIKGGTGQAGASRELDDLLAMIFSQDATAKYICTKLYRWFVDYVIDATIEQNVIEPMADILRTNNYEIKPVLDTLFKSAHFYDTLHAGCVIKNPVDFTMGTLRTFYVADIYPSDVKKQNWAYRTLRRITGTMGMDLMNPPNVAGWSAYWQKPDYHELWINADTLQKRIKFVDDLSFNGLQLDESYDKSYIDPFEIINWVSDPFDPTVLINEVSRLLFPVELTDAQKALLNDILLPGLPDYEWGIEWNAYKSNPTDAAAKKAVGDKLQAFLKYMLEMAEYQLS